MAHTCNTCRARHVRCDGRQSVCTNCERLGFPCSYEEKKSPDELHVDVGDHAGDSGGGGVGIPRRRVRQACSLCHAKKARCSGTLPKCDRCQVQGLDCVYRPNKRSLPLPRTARGEQLTARGNELGQISERHRARSFEHSPVRSSTGSPVALASPLPVLGARPSGCDKGLDELAMRTFDNFFRHIHHVPVFSFLHRASLMERYHAGLLDQALLLALVGITSLLTDLGTTQEYGNKCIDEAVTLVLAELEKPSVLRLQALVIIVKHRMLTRQFSSAFMLHATACRFATALRLNYENPNLGFLPRESRRRLMWSVYMIDSSIADGQLDLAIWPDAERQIHLQLPCNERNFEFDLPEPTEMLRPPPLTQDGTLVPLPDEVGFSGLHLRIQWIRCRILQYTTKMVNQPSAEDIAALPSKCAEFTAELVAFEARLPLSFRWSESSFRLRTYSPRLCIFIMTHVLWRQCHLDLYRLFLPGFKEALPMVFSEQLSLDVMTTNRRCCYEHAKALADIFAQLLTLGSGVPVTDLDLVTCAYQCSRVLNHAQQSDVEGFDLPVGAVRNIATVCKRVADRSANVPAFAVVVKDIQRLVDGRELEGGGNDGLRARPPPAVTEIPMGVEDLSGAGRQQNNVNVVSTLSMGDTPMSDLRLAGPGSLPDSLVSLSGAMGTPQVYPEPNMTQTPARSNAFDGALEGITFGPDSFDVDWSASLSEDWFSIPVDRQNMEEAM